MSRNRGRRQNKNSNSSKNRQNNTNYAKNNVIKGNSKGGILDELRTLRPIDHVSCAFIIYMVTFYLIYMDKQYFNITFTRADVFWKGSLTFIVIAAGAYFYDLYIEMRDPIKIGLKKMIFIKDTKLYLLPEFWMCIFLIANIIAFFNADERAAAWTGDSGRFFGLKMVLIITVMFFILSRSCYVNFVNYILGLIVSVAAVVIAYLQHFGADPFKLRAEIYEKQKELFVSLFGNLNTYGSFLAIAAPAVAAVMIFSKKKWIKIVSAIGIFIIAVGIIPAKSDNVYLGIGAAMLVLMFLAIYYKHLTSFMLSCDLMLAGLYFMAYMNHAGKGSQKHINGIAEVIESPKIMLVLFIGFILLTAATAVLDKCFLQKLDKKALKKVLFAVGAAVMILMAAFCVIGIKMKLSIFVFDDKWGTYRGYIWKRSVSLFGRANPWQKLFGYGNESISEYMLKYYKDEMIEVTNRTYDNCHNELLQYLVTTGIVGVLSYIGLFVTGMVYLIKNSSESPVILSLAAACTGYWIQGIVYLNQPITSPLYFVFLAAGIGYIRFMRRREEDIVL